MRIRTVKPEFFLHEDLYELEKETGLPIRISFAGLWCAADREGRFKWEPRRLGIQILPYDQIDFSRVLDALTTRAFILKYRVCDECFGVIPTFGKHQVINNRERDSELPEPTDYENIDASTTRQPRVAHASKAEGKGREHGREGNMEQGKARETRESGPYSEEESMMPPNTSRLSQTRKGQIKVKGNTPIMNRIGSFLNRRESNIWTVEELESFLAVKPPIEEIEGLEIYYTSPAPRERDNRRTSLITLLNNWNTTELDRARAFINSKP